jgi:cytoskeletal protein CcmA (bactofilin family)
MMMWKSSQSPMVVPKPAPEPIRFDSATPANEYGGRNTSERDASEYISRHPAVTAQVGAQAAIGKGMVFKGTVTGNGSIVVDGELTGVINLPDGRVTVGPFGVVSDGLSVCINAREIIIMGKVRGHIRASDRVEVRAEGTLQGNVSTARISIADGAYFKGDIDLRNAQPKTVAAVIDAEEEQQRAYA